MGRRDATWRPATAQSGRRGRDSDGADEPRRSCDLPETPSRAAARECRHALRRSGTRGSRGLACPCRGRAGPGSLRAREIAAARGLPASTGQRAAGRCRRDGPRRSSFRPESVLRPWRARLTPAPSRGSLRRVLAVEPANLAKLPSRPGVYFFVDARGRLLYIGRAANLRSRVRSYWTAGLDRPGLRGVSETDLEQLSQRATGVLERDRSAVIDTVDRVRRERDRASELRLYERASELQRQIDGILWITQRQDVMRLAVSGDRWAVDESRIDELVAAIA